MTILKNPPKTKHKMIQQIFAQAESDLKLAMKEKQIPKGEGLFGESREYIVFELAKALNQNTDALNTAQQTNELLLLMFRDAQEDLSVEGIIQAMTLCLHGFVFGNYSEEDFRFLYRYSLRYIRRQAPIEKWLRKAVVYLVAINNESTKDILAEVRYWIQFLGAPLFMPSMFSEVGKELGIDIQAEIESEQFRLVDAVTRHPQYLKEAVQDMTLLDSFEGLKDWGPDAIQLQLLKIKKKEI